MPKYAAFLRGIGPSNPNMRQEKLKWFFEKLGFKNVKVVISSGNVIFEAASKNTSALETKIEQALPKHLKFNSMTIVRSQQELEKMIKQNPFKKLTHGTKTYLMVTFIKNKPKPVFNVFDLTGNKGPEVMTKLEKDHGKQITTRTWKTINRIVDRF